MKKKSWGNGQVFKKKKSSGHRQLLWLASGETGPGVNISQCWTAAGTHGGSYICANSPTCSKRHGSQRWRAASANEQTELSAPSNNSKQRENIRISQRSNVLNQMRFFHICYHAAVDIFTIKLGKPIKRTYSSFCFRLKSEFLHPQASWEGVIWGF